MKYDRRQQRFPCLDEYEQSLIAAEMQRQDLTDESVASEMKCKRETFNRYKRGIQGVSAERRRWLEEFFALPMDALRSQLGRKRVFSGSMEYGEIKNVVADKIISDAILSFPPPPFAICVEHTRVIRPDTIPEKLAPKKFLPDYNHFFQPAAVFRVSEAGSRVPRLLCYRREAIPATPQYRLTTGMSILWAASYDFRSYRAEQPMDFWLRKIREGAPNAGALFLDGPGSILLRLLSYKLQLRDIRDVKFTPFGIATVDLTATRKSIYTQYIFIGTLTFVQLPKHLDDLSPLKLNVDLIGEGEDPVKICVNKEGKPLTLDIATWLALNSPGQNSVNVEKATFRRGFDLF